MAAGIWNLPARGNPRKIQGPWEVQCNQREQTCPSTHTTSEAPRKKSMQSRPSRTAQAMIVQSRSRAMMVKCYMGTISTTHEQVHAGDSTNSAHNKSWDRRGKQNRYSGSRGRTEFHFQNFQRALLLTHLQQLHGPFLIWRKASDLPCKGVVQ